MMMQPYEQTMAANIGGCFYYIRRIPFVFIVCNLHTHTSCDADPPLAGHLHSARAAEDAVDLPVRLLAGLGAVVHLRACVSSSSTNSINQSNNIASHRLARAAHHQTAAELELQTVGADVLAPVDGGGVAARRERQGRGALRVVREEHPQEHAAHEVVLVVVLHHGAEAEVVPDLAEHQPTVLKVGTHHAAEERALVLRRKDGVAVAGVHDLLLEHDGELGVHVPPHGVRICAPDGRVERLERGRALHHRHRAVEHMEVDVHVDHHRRQRLRRGPLLDVDLQLLRLHVQRRRRKDQPAGLIRFEPMPNQRVVDRHMIENALYGDDDADEIVRPYGVDRYAHIVCCARLILAAVVCVLAREHRYGRDDVRSAFCVDARAGGEDDGLACAGVWMLHVLIV